MTEAERQPPRVSRIERRVLAGIVLLALAVRLWDLPRLEISHFDEGVYAYWGQKSLGLPWQYPYREFYGPSVFPTLVGWSYLVFGRSGPAAVLPSALLGVATAVAVWWLGRRVFSPTAGLVAALLLALNDLHITYSRAALVDVSLTFFLVLAMACFCQVLRSGSWWWTVGAGLATGLAWNTKYNGFLPVVVALGALAGWAVQTHEWKRALGLLARIAVAGVIAGLCYLPWFLHVDQAYGYARLLEHQRGYMRGLAGWLGGASHQLGCWHVFRLWGTGLAGVGLLVGVGAAAARRRWLLAHPLLVLVVVTVVLGPDYVLLAGAAAWGVDGWRRRNAQGWLLAAWVVVLIALVPLYTPYTRLAVPLVPVLVLLCADLGVRCAGVLWRADDPEHLRRARVCVLGTVAGALVLFVAGGQSVHMNLAALWRAATDRGGYADAGQWIASQTPRDAVVRYYAQPPVAFYTPRRVEPTPDPRAAWRPPPGPAYVVVDFMAQGQPTWRHALERAGTPVVTIPNRPSIPTMLDQVGPRRVWHYWGGARPEFRRIRIYRITDDRKSGRKALP